MSQTRLNSTRLEALNLLEGALGYCFNKPQLLLEALTHSSATQEFVKQTDADPVSNERLEFLGDAVLGLVVATELINRPQSYAEGDMSRLRAAVVQESVLADIARTIGLGSALFLGRGEQLGQGKDKPSILADGLEAVIGAIYQDGGFQSAEKVVRRLMETRWEADIDHVVSQDFKSALQELTQSKYQEMPEYQVINQRGPAHNPEFDVAVQLQGRTIGRGTGNSKKRAAQQAAASALGTLMEPAND